MRIRSLHRGCAVSVGLGHRRFRLEERVGIVPSTIWLRIKKNEYEESWVRGDEVTLVSLTTRAGSMRQAESYGVTAAWSTQDRTSSELTSGIASRAEAMSVVRRILELLASPPGIVGLVSVDGTQVRLEALSD